MAFDAGSIRVRLELDGKVFVGEFKKVEQEVGKFEGRIRASGAGTTQLNRIMSGTLGTLRSFWGGVLQLATAFGIATSATALLNQAVTLIRSTFIDAFRAVSDLRESAVEIAAIMTSFAEDPSPKTFAQNLAFAREEIIRLQKESARFGVSSTSAWQTFQAFVTFGIIPTTKEADEAMISIARSIAAVTRGQNLQFQIWQEIRGIMTGMIQPGSILARMIQTQVGNLQEWVRLHRQAGDLPEALAKVMRGIVEAQGEINKLTSRWHQTLGVIFTLISQEAFAGVYDDIVKFLKSIADALLQGNELTALSRTIIARVEEAWVRVKTVAIGTFEWMRDNGPAILKLIEDGARLIALALKPLQIFIEQVARTQAVREAMRKGLLPRSIIFATEEVAEEARELLARNRIRREAETQARIQHLRETGQIRDVKREEAARRQAAATGQRLDEAQLRLQEKLLTEREKATEVSVRARLGVLQREYEEWKSLATGNQKLLELVEQVASERRLAILKEFTGKVVEEYDKIVRGIRDAQREIQRAEFDRIEAVGNMERAANAARIEGLRRSLDLQKDQATATEAVIRRQIENLRLLRSQQVAAGFLPGEPEIAAIDRSLQGLQTRLLKLFDPAPILEFHKAVAQLELAAVQGQIELQKTIVATAQDPRDVARALTQLAELYQQEAKIRADVAINTAEVERSAAQKTVQERITALEKIREQKLEEGFLPTDFEVKQIDLKLIHFRDQLAAASIPTDETRDKVAQFFKDAADRIKELVQPTKDAFTKIRQETILDTLDPLVKRFGDLKSEVQEVFDFIIKVAPEVRGALQPLIDDLDRILKAKPQLTPTPIIAPSKQLGGQIGSTGLYQLHKGEFVVPPGFDERFVPILNALVGQLPAGRLRDVLSLIAPPGGVRLSEAAMGFTGSLQVIGPKLAERLATKFLTEGKFLGEGAEFYARMVEEGGQKYVVKLSKKPETFFEQSIKEVAERASRLRFAVPTQYYQDTVGRQYLIQPFIEQVPRATQILGRHARRLEQLFLKMAEEQGLDIADLQLVDRIFGFGSLGLGQNVLLGRGPGAGLRAWLVDIGGLLSRSREFGGPVSETGAYGLHKDEFVLSSSDVRRLGGAGGIADMLRGLNGGGPSVEININGQKIEITPDKYELLDPLLDLFLTDPGVRERVRQELQRGKT